MSEILEPLRNFLIYPGFGYSVYIDAWHPYELIKLSFGGGVHLQKSSQNESGNHTSQLWVQKYILWLCESVVFTLWRKNVKRNFWH